MYRASETSRPGDLRQLPLKADVLVLALRHALRLLLLIKGPDTQLKNKVGKAESTHLASTKVLPDASSKGVSTV